MFLRGNIRDAARTPHGDGNLIHYRLDFTLYLMQPTPLTGTATLPAAFTSRSKEDAARTPQGDSNDISQIIMIGSSRCSPHPSGGQQL